MTSRERGASADGSRRSRRERGASADGSRRSRRERGASADGSRRSRRSRAACAVAAAALGLLAIVACPPERRAEAATFDAREVRGPLGPITVIGDSVMVGSIRFDPDLLDRLVERGWGPVRAKAGEGDTSGYFPVPATYKASHWIQTWRAQGWDPPAVVVNVGVNDSGWCGNHPLGQSECSYRAIRHLVDTIGPGKRIWWPKITRTPSHQRHQAAWNAALDRVAAERADFYTWDWPAVMAAMGESAPDRVHLSPTGYRERSRLMADEITAFLARGSMTGGPAKLPAAPAAKSELVPIGPTRVLDTRRQSPGRLAAGDRIEIDVSDHVPPGATAVAAYVTAVAPSAAGHLGADACTGAQSSFANYPPGVTRGAVTITPLTARGTFCVASHASAHLVVDLQAAFVPDRSDSDALRLDAAGSPDRLLDTRRTGRSRHVELAVPAGASAVALNITAVGASAPGHIVAHPCRTPTPTVANVNYLAHEVVAGAAYVPVSPTGTICIDTHTPVDLVVDLTGTFSSTGALAFQPVAPTRVLDTRRGIGGWTPIHGLGQTVGATVAPADARAVTGTITLVAPLRNSHLQAWGCGVRDENSNVNAAAGATLANFLTTGITQGKLCIHSVSTGHTVVDTTGWWVP